LDFGFVKLNDEELEQLVFMLTHPVGAWNGMRLFYQTGPITLSHDANGHEQGMIATSGEAPAQVYQFVDGEGDSPTTDVP